MSPHLSAYLTRLNLDAAPRPDVEGLAQVQAAHRRAIAFENLDIRLGRPIRIDSESVFDKLVMRRRGGYCFEQNRLFADMLALLGLPSRPLLARVQLGAEPGEVMPRTHTLLLLEIDGAPWVADAGFGGSFVPPLPLRDGVTVTTPDGASHRLRLVSQSNGQWLLERRGDTPAAMDNRAEAGAGAGWQPQYLFDLTPVAPIDLELSNHWTATRPDTRFTSLHIASIVLPDGFVALTETALTLYRGGKAERREIADAEEYRAVLTDHCGLTLSRDEVAQLPLFASSRPQSI